MLPHHCFVYCVLHLACHDKRYLCFNDFTVTSNHCVLCTLAYWFTLCSESEYKIKIN